MPTLKLLTCSLELGQTGTKLKEYAHSYTDGGVEAYVAIPPTDLSFQLRVTSNGYIAPGLAAYVFIDGQYQCNRNRQRLQIPSSGTEPRDYEVEFCFRQREEKTSEGHFIAREWTFAKLKTAAADDLPGTNSDFARNVGTIEVVVLRCKDAALQMPPTGIRSYIATPNPMPTTRIKPAVLRAADLNSQSRAPSKTIARSSGKKSSVAADDMLGGMAGLFDGAGDEPDFPKHQAGYFVGRTCSPGYRWGTLSGDHRGHQHESPFITRHDRGQYLSRATAENGPGRYEQRPYATHGAHASFNRTPVSFLPGRPRAAADLYGLEVSPRHVHARFQQNPITPPHQPGGSLLSDLHDRPGAEETPDDFEFVRSMCKQVEEIHRSAYKVARKIESLNQDLESYRNDPDLHLAVMKALHHKEATIQSYNEEVAAIFSAIFLRMRRMGRHIWYHSRDYLVVERGLVPAEHPEMHEWQDPKLRHLELPISSRPGEHSHPEHDAEWQQVGKGDTGVSLWERRQKEGEQVHRSEAVRAKSIATTGEAKDKNWNSPDDIDQKQNLNCNAGDGHLKAEKLELDGPAGNTGQNKDGHDNSGSARRLSKDKTEKAEDGLANQNSDQKRWEESNNQIEDKAQPGNVINDWGNSKNMQPTNAVCAASAWPGDSWANDDWGSEQSKKSKQDNDLNLKANSWQGHDVGEHNANLETQTRSQGRSSKAKWRNDGDDNHRNRSNAVIEQMERPCGQDCRGSTTNTNKFRPVIKSYWTNWNKTADHGEQAKQRPRNAYEYSAPPKPTRMSDQATDISYGVAAGRGATYVHNTFRPEYLDTMEKPYAIFTFKYRSKHALEKILKRKIDASDLQRAVEKAEKHRLSRIPKDELIQQLLKMKHASSPTATGKTPSTRHGNTTGYGAEQKTQDGDNGDRSGDKGDWSDNAPWGDNTWDDNPSKDKTNQRPAPRKDGADKTNNKDRRKKGIKSAVYSGDGQDNAKPLPPQSKSASRKSQTGYGNGGWDDTNKAGSTWGGDKVGKSESNKSSTVQHFEGDKNVQKFNPQESGVNNDAVW